MNLKKSFAQKLKLIRKRCGLTQEELAELVDVAPRHISFIETARSFPSCDLLERLCKVLNIDYAELFEFEEEISRNELMERTISELHRLDDKQLKYIYKMAAGLQGILH